jgi:hypothetical protein
MPSKLGGSGRPFESALTRQKSTDSSESGSGTGKEKNGAASGVLLESKTQLFEFSTATVGEGSFQVATGYKQVTSPMERR